MTIAILIGFEYMFNKLEGTIIDLYHGYKWCNTFDCNIYIFTDISCINNIDNLKSAINKKIVDEGILTFFDDIPYKNVINDGISLIMGIINILKNSDDNKIIIYYTGHGIKDCIVMPDRSLLPFIDFRNNILNVLDKYTEIFCILDCCNPDGLYLPYKLDGNNFLLSPSKISCVTNPILLITSSNIDEKSIATKYGSIFSRHLFKILHQLNNKLGKKIICNEKNRNLCRLISNLTSSIKKIHTGYIQTVSIYSSYIIPPVLWMWIGSDLSYDIVSDISLNFLVLRENSNKKEYKSYNPYDILYSDSPIKLY